MLTRLQHGHPIEELKPVVAAEDVIACQEAIRDVQMDDKVKRYILEVVHASRDNEDVLLGGSPRASIALFRTAQALAAVNGRDFVLPDDVKKMAQPVLAHRLILKPESRLRKRTPTLVVSADDVLACQEAIRGIHVDDKVTRYILQVVHASRDNEDVLLGGSPRASIALFRTAQALAAVSGRDFAAPDDVKKMAQPVLAHRLILKPESRLRKRTPAAVVKDLVDDAKVPITDKMKAAQADYFDD